MVVNGNRGQAMASITIKNIPPEVHQRLKDRARRNRRSLQKEILECLTIAVLPRRMSPEEVIAQAREMRKLFKGEADPDEIIRIIRKGRE